MLPQRYPGLQQFADNLTAALGKVEVIRQPIYDFILYPTAGSAAPLQFFTIPIGQGISSSSGNVANPKGLTDTNMQLAGQLAAPQAFWCDGIEVDVQPGSSGAANTFVLQPPSSFLAVQTAGQQAGAQDVHAITGGGVLDFRISNKNYYQEGPLYRFPTRAARALESSIGAASLGGAGTNTGTKTYENMRVVGDPVRLDPGFGIMSSQAFGVSITYPVAIATPSGFNARIGVILNGWTFRPVQ